MLDAYLSPELVDVLLRLGTATLAGMAIGLNRDLKGKPSGVRTLALVALGAALVTVATVRHEGIRGHPDALSRVVQGVIQGIMAGVGFIVAGMVFRDKKAGEVRNLTTAATVWVTAALGIACALASWAIVATGLVLTFLVLFCGGPVERLLSRLLLPPDPPVPGGEDRQ